MSDGSATSAILLSPTAPSILHTLPTHNWCNRKSGRPMEELIILSQIFQACVPNRSGMLGPGWCSRPDMYLSGRTRHNHHTYSPSFISPSGEYFEMVRGLMDRTQLGPITLFVHHLQSQCGARAAVDKIFQLTADCQVPGSYSCSYVRDRLIGPGAQISRWSLDF